MPCLTGTQKTIVEKSPPMYLFPSKNHHRYNTSCTFLCIVMCGYIFVRMYLYHIFIYVPLSYFASTRDIFRKSAYVLKCGLEIRSLVWNKSSIIDTCVIDVGDSPVTNIEIWKWCICIIVIHVIDLTKWSVFTSFCLNWNLIRSVQVTSKKLFGELTYILWTPTPHFHFDWWNGPALETEWRGTGAWSYVQGPRGQPLSVADQPGSAVAGICRRQFFFV